MLCLFNHPIMKPVLFLFNSYGTTGLLFFYLIANLYCAPLTIEGTLRFCFPRCIWPVVYGDTLLVFLIGLLHASILHRIHRNSYYVVLRSYLVWPGETPPSFSGRLWEMWCSANISVYYYFLHQGRIWNNLPQRRIKVCVLSYNIKLATMWARISSLFLCITMELCVSMSEWQNVCGELP
jgi:hypothetical protein